MSKLQIIGAKSKSLPEKSWRNSESGSPDSTLRFGTVSLKLTSRLGNSTLGQRMRHGAAMRDGQRSCEPSRCACLLS